MKKNYLIATSFLLVFFFSSNMQAQEWSTGMDIYSSYIWRGSKFGTGPAFQPSVEFSAGSFSLGAWGSVSTSAPEAAETDLYAGYTFGLGEKTSLGLTLTDYYFPGSPYFEYTGDAASHAFEANLGYEIGGLSLSANMFLNASPDGAGTAGQDLYFEVGYSFSYFGILLDDNNRKPICRLHFNYAQKYLGILKDKEEDRVPINDLDEIFQYADRIKDTVREYL